MSRRANKKRGKGVFAVIDAGTRMDRNVPVILLSSNPWITSGIANF
ncbi:hypothetical protein [Vibrio sp. Isolate30]|nr:hypothetical protein [Vibrio sp. Isolate30]MCG9632890.1 hypothetical protein [Vibrio sp. Isolate30]